MTTGIAWYFYISHNVPAPNKKYSQFSGLKEHCGDKSSRVIRTTVGATIFVEHVDNARTMRNSLLDFGLK